MAANQAVARADLASPGGVVEVRVGIDGNHRLILKSIPEFLAMSVARRHMKAAVAQALSNGI